MKGEYFDDKIIYALATGFTTSAIAVFRISGEGCISALSNALNKPISLTDPAFFTGKGVVYRSVISCGEKIDDCLITVFKKGHGYTKEESAELSFHGSRAVIRRVDSLFSSLGFRQAQKGEFTFRAMQNGALTLLESEAVLELIDSDSENRRKNAIKRLEGSLDDKLHSIYKKLISLLSVFELQMDYSEDEFDEDTTFPEALVSEIKAEIVSLISTFKVSQKEEEGVRVVILGNANEGKSTLFNTLIHQDRSIVSSYAGTTRDYIKETAELCGEKVIIYDTAGFNTSALGVEKQGIDLSHKLEKEADIIIRLLSEDEKVSDFPDDSRTIFVRNKSDIRKSKYTDNCIKISAKTTLGLDLLLEELSSRIEKLVDLHGSEHSVLIGTSRQKKHLESAYSSLLLLKPSQALEELCIDTQNALCAFRELLGLDEKTDEVLDEIFSHFCVGK